ncbi:winged helix-turn-helix transcriptional regulator [Infirmifilum lucidum]|uniref:Winged helix-turn-helix transcriptional regulator n=1 Tax=Infirmifilum lucidum TaxID=2776706 RepID=A0A7L9FG67_9CREN|nr:winged helix-turn-helix transcriptional regulator [Infirmifilum lucidum]QOJ78611.1 winged helix-turn-helix transcriptional regulator [Infirmifilum lucidum]
MKAPGHEAALALLASVALGIALVLYYQPTVYASPSFLPLDSRVTLFKTLNSTDMLLVLSLPPYAQLEKTRLGCIANASSVEATAPGLSLEVRREGGLYCIYASAVNPTPQFTSVEVRVHAALLQGQTEQLPAALLVAVAAVGAASYLSLTEKGRDIVFRVASVPVAYALVNRENALRNARRRLIYEYVRRNPGVGPRAISRGLGISFGEVQWHLSVLERVGLVARASLVKRALYYPAETPLHEWLPSFARRELGIRVRPEHVQRNEYRIRVLLAKGCTVAELKALLASTS